MSTGLHEPFPAAFRAALLAHQFDLITEAHIANLITRLRQAVFNKPIETATRIHSLPSYRMWLELALTPTVLIVGVAANDPETGLSAFLDCIETLELQDPDFAGLRFWTLPHALLTETGERHRRNLPGFSTESYCVLGGFK